MCPATKSGRSESGPFVTDDYFLGAPVEDNTASECVHTVAATYGCKILQLYEYNANAMDTMRTANDTPRIPVRAA